MDLPSRFEPGTEIQDLGMVRETSLELREIQIRFPNRIHMTPIDCNRFGFGEPGGGGIGFAIDLGSTLRISTSRHLEVEVSRPTDIPLMVHYSRVMQQVLNTRQEFHFSLHMANTVKQHFGLGSSVSVACAVVFGINKMFRDPLSVDEMRRLIAHNFVEEFEGEVSRGLETGVGTSVILKGGIAVIANGIVEVFRRPFPQGYAVLLVDPRTSRPESNRPESEDMLRRTFHLDGSYRYTKAYDILMDIIPAIDAGDFRKVGDYVWDIQFSGTHLSMIQSYEAFGEQIYKTLGILRGAEAAVCGLSSVGPAIYAICLDEMKDAIAESVVQQCERVSVMEVRANNNGICVVETRP